MKPSPSRSFPIWQAVTGAQTRHEAPRSQRDALRSLRRAASDVASAISVRQRIARGMPAVDAAEEVLAQAIGRPLAGDAERQVAYQLAQRVRELWRG